MRDFSPFLKWVLIPLAILTIFHLSTAKETQSMPHSLGLDLLFNQVIQWRKNHIGKSQDREVNLGFHSIIAGVLCFLASSIFSAGGIGSGALFLPVLYLIAGLDLKKATTFSALLVTGGAVSNVLYNLIFEDPKYGGKSLIDYEISLLSEPCMLLGLIIGVICNFIFPEWLMTLLLVLLLASSTFKTCWAGLLCWKTESDEVRRSALVRLRSENGRRSALVRLRSENGRDERINVGEDENGMENPLLEDKTETELGIPVKKMVVFLMVWLSFYVLHVLRGDVDGKHPDLQELMDEAPFEGEITGRLWDEMSQKIDILRQRLQELEWCDEHHILLGESSAGPSPSSSSSIERDWEAEVEATRRQLADAIKEHPDLQELMGEAPFEGEITGRLWDEMSQKIDILRQRLQELVDAKEWCDEHHILLGESSTGPSSSSSSSIERDWEAEVEATRRQLADAIKERDELVATRQAWEERIANLEMKLQEVTTHEAEFEARLAPFVDQLYVQQADVAELRLHHLTDIVLRKQMRPRWS